ncbi:MAG: hypothetical protein RLY71_2594 [Pseudomonadota bacterium]|jgi:sugar lactone lactonase YvrE
MNKQQTPRSWTTLVAFCTLLATALVLASCGGGSTQGQMSRGATTYPISGKVAGLARDKVTLQNGVDTVDAIPKDASGNDIEFTIAALPSNAKYDIQVVAKPDGTDCKVINGVGTVHGQAVSNIVVQCFDVKSLVLVAGAKFTQASQNSTVDEATFSSIGPAAIDSLGNIFVIDKHSIRKITPTGIVTTFAGVPDLAGDVVGVGRLARFSSPQGIAVDERNWLVIADTGNSAIKMISPSGDVSVIAGGTDRNDADSAYVKVDLNNPKGLAYKYENGVGIVYIADTLNHVVRTLHLLPENGQYTTEILAGTEGVPGRETDAADRFNQPTSVAIDAAGHIIVADSFNRAIRKITSDGHVTVVAGSSTAEVTAVDGTGTAAAFQGPNGVTIDRNGMLYVTDPGCHRIRRIDQNATVRTIISTPLGCAPTDKPKEFTTPQYVAAQPDGTILVSEQGDQTLRRLTPSNLSKSGVDEIGSYAGVGNGFGFVDESRSKARFNVPQGITAGSDGTIYVADSGNSAIRMIGTDGLVTTLHSHASNTTDQLGSPAGIVVDGTGNIYVSDPVKHSIFKIDANEDMTLLTGKTESGRLSDGVLGEATFTRPKALAYADTSVLYVLDGNQNGPNSIRKIDLVLGRVTTLTINGISQFSGFALAPDRRIYVYRNGTATSLLYRLNPTAQMDTFDAELITPLTNPFDFRINALAFDDAVTAYVYGSNGIQLLNLGAGVVTTLNVVVTGSSVKNTIPGPLPALVAVRGGTVNGVPVDVTGLTVLNGRLIFSDNTSVYAVIP